ncbi:PREDICTED: RUS1 family protein C16orf58 homolog isoform X2 [Propithecus coquereli]|uniref:RUS1 family protein C16orf58 homolog isoform X2 n=1 Tax=Propithecus coquereli TaxID=379532 RepID=UPI00063FC319|nr:PREDICTED: RUS1 family protein C16orf58 homolog isoform X2 [Propithecus coquereli]
MAEGASREAQLCSEQFGSGAARGCRAAADGSLQWEARGWSWWGFSGAFPVRPEGRDEGGAGAPGTSSPPLSGLQAVFLPQGFPDSVSPDYLPYQLWDSVQAFASSLSGSLATQAVLLGIGVGNAKASVSAATATWLVKDSTGMLGRIVFAWWKGSKLDCNAKQWRLFADILNDVAMFLEIMAPIYPICFTMTVCTSNLAKCIVSVAGGATRAALTMHQARRNNMADVSAKDSSQETLVNLAGLLVSLLMLPLVSGCPSPSPCHGNLKRRPAPASPEALPSEGRSTRPHLSQSDGTAVDRFLAIPVSIPGGPPTPPDLQVSGTVSPSHHFCHPHSPRMLLIPVTHWPSPIMSHLSVLGSSFLLTDLGVSVGLGERKGYMA